MLSKLYNATITAEKGNIVNSLHCESNQNIALLPILAKLPQCSKIAFL